MKKNIVFASIVLGMVFLVPQISFSQKKDEKKKEKKGKTAQDDKTKTTTTAPATPKTIASVISKCKPYNGLFNLYQSETDGSVYMLIKKDQMNKDYIYFSHTVDAAVDGGHQRGAFEENKVFMIRRYFDKIEFVGQNTNFYFDPNNAISKAANANINEAIMISEKIEAEDKEKGDILIKADKVFLGEDINPIKPNYPASYQGFRLGGLNKEKTKYLKFKNYPKNTDVVVEYVYDNAFPQGNTGEEITDGRFVGVKSQHSIIEVPQNTFRTVMDDPRVGFFEQRINDMTTPKSANYRDVIHKWHLEKKDPNSALSEPIEPITYWIENTTPLEYRDVIMRAGLAWNEAFEKAGFKNAIVMKIQPDTATWDAGDIRYNVLRWASSPQPSYGGYGPSFVNPRTGQILGADIMLEYVFVTNRMRQESIYKTSNSQTEETAENSFLKNHKYCSISDHLHQNAMFGATTLQLLGGNQANATEYLESSLFYLTLHEMGHTLGLMHNMKASQLNTPQELQNKELTLQKGLTGSVMDYPAVNLNHKGEQNVLHFNQKPGAYDLWVIEFGYGNVADPNAEKLRREKLLARSTEPALVFGNDADDMRSPGKAIDPRVMIDDMSSDAISYAADRIKFASEMISKLKEKYVASHQNESYQELRSQYSVLAGEQARSGGVIARYIGGVYVDRAFVGQQGATKPFTPVAYQDQKRAMKALEDLIFSPKALQAPQELYTYLQTQRRSYDFFGTHEDPKNLDRVLNAQTNVLLHLLHPATTKRILDSEIYGNQYKINEMMEDLTNAIFKDDLATNTNLFRQNIQIEYMARLLSISGLDGRASVYAYPVQSAALAQLNKIKTMLNTNRGAEASTKAHRDHILFKINKAFKD
jgi:hypothetical protein